MKLRKKPFRMGAFAENENILLLCRAFSETNITSSHNFRKSSTLSLKSKHISLSIDVVRGGGSSITRNLNYLTFSSF